MSIYLCRGRISCLGHKHDFQDLDLIMEEIAFNCDLDNPTVEDCRFMNKLRDILHLARDQTTVGSPLDRDILHANDVLASASAGGMYYSGASVRETTVDVFHKVISEFGERTHSQRHAMASSLLDAHVMAKELTSYIGGSAILTGSDIDSCTSVRTGPGSCCGVHKNILGMSERLYSFLDGMLVGFEGDLVWGFCGNDAKWNLKPFCPEWDDSIVLSRERFLGQIGNLYTQVSTFLDDVYESGTHIHVAMNKFLSPDSRISFDRLPINAVVELNLGIDSASLH